MGEFFKHGRRTAGCVTLLAIAGCEAQQPQRSVPAPMPTQEELARVAIRPGRGPRVHGVPAYIKTHTIRVPDVHWGGKGFKHDGAEWDLVTGSPIGMISRTEYRQILEVTEYPDEIHYNGSVFRRRNTRPVTPIKAPATSEPPHDGDDATQHPPTEAP